MAKVNSLRIKLGEPIKQIFIILLREQSGKRVFSQKEAKPSGTLVRNDAKPARRKASEGGTTDEASECHRMAQPGKLRSVAMAAQ